ncbi:ubiquinol-cytochrome C chaperone family protein [Falsiroseomonas selenitidurans]|uniref:Ubiquinol-cytochrome C chaperone n=1 Tax=Falsiroseomonas selenitidurans TaxID=2716335 RepID=A0ABX1DY21_9PROT|nr:ubiquinol-cytochrome C chaperone family protein [Falsiroseomonas selenitidurans]NKC29265.1 ubiquinol-cytochrome C chaperone [Falsiroseomonas selenitidurans]OYW09617.1 MAG: ubiquinol-cytochrome C chaperone [Rhodospirillales bacterium 12-71-4]
MGLLGLLGRRPHERAGFALYTAAVSASRQPGFFGGLGVPDTLDGRFDLVSLHVALLIRRLRRDADPAGPKLAQAVFDAMFADMDVNLREMGVGDLVVGKRVKRMWEAFHGRAAAYESALDAADAAALAAALARNIWRGEAPPPGAAERLAGLAIALDRTLSAQDVAALRRGQVRFPEQLAA